MDLTNEGSKRLATIGGTFDALHQGHQDYIKLAFAFSDHTVIYLSTNEYLNGKTTGRKNYQVRSYEERYNKLAEFIKEIGCENKCEIRRHNHEDDFKSSYLNEFTNPDVLYMAIVSPEYYTRFLEINRLRETNGMKGILLVVKPRFRFGNTDLSSSSIRGSLQQAPASYSSSLTSTE
jgi:cytidyltransferase-like protein